MAENTENKRMAKQPMLYIAQPKFKPAEVSMQTSFVLSGANLLQHLPSSPLNQRHPRLLFMKKN